MALGEARLTGATPSHTSARVESLERGGCAPRLRRDHHEECEAEITHGISNSPWRVRGPLHPYGYSINVPRTADLKEAPDHDRFSRERGRSPTGPPPCSECPVAPAADGLAGCADNRDRHRVGDGDRRGADHPHRPQELPQHRVRAVVVHTDR